MKVHYRASLVDPLPCASLSPNDTVISVSVRQVANVYITFSRLCLMNFHRLLRELPTKEQQLSTQNDYDDNGLAPTRRTNRR